MGNARVVELGNDNKVSMFFDELYGSVVGKGSVCDADCQCKKCRAKRQRKNTTTQVEQMQNENSFVENEMSENLSSFDSVENNNLPGAEDRFNDVFPKQIIINPQVQDVADKMVWNKMMIDKLKRERGNTNNKQNVSIVIIERTKRMRELKDNLENYQNAVGEDYSNFDDMQLECRCRKIEVSKAIKNAQDKARGKKPIEPVAGVIPVEKTLNPEFSEGRIYVPSKEESKSNATGLNGIDDRADFDAPPIREVFINADGKSTLNINWGSFLIGGIVAIGALWAIKKYNLLKGI